MLRPLILPSGSTSNSPPPPFSSLFYLHPTYRHPPFTILSPSLPISFFLFFFFWPLHILSIFPASVAFSSHTPPPPSSYHHHHHHHLPPSRWRPYTDRSADSLVVSHFPREQTAAAEAAGGAETVIPPQSHTPHPTPPHPTQKPVAGGGGGGGGGGGAQPLGTPVLLDPLFSVFVKPDFFFFLKKSEFTPNPK